MHKALLDDALPLMDTTTYSFKFIGIDPASNISDPAIREPIYYDISPPSIHRYIQAWDPMLIIHGYQSL